MERIIGNFKTVFPPLLIELQRHLALVKRVVDAALEGASWAPMTTLNVTVASGVADVWGTITNPDERRAICVIAENVSGVKEVHDHLVYVEPYTGTVIESPDDHP